MLFYSSATIFVLFSLVTAELVARKSDADAIWAPQHLIAMSSNDPTRIFGESKIPTLAHGQIIQVQFNMDTKLGELCDLYFTFPQRAAPKLATFKLTGKPTFMAQQLAGAIWPETTTYENRPHKFGVIYAFTMKENGNTKVATVKCPPKGQTIGFEIWTDSLTGSGKFVQIHGRGLRDNGVFMRQYSA